MVDNRSGILVFLRHFPHYLAKISSHKKSRAETSVSLIMPRPSILDEVKDTDFLSQCMHSDKFYMTSFPSAKSKRESEACLPLALTAKT